MLKPWWVDYDGGGAWPIVHAVQMLALRLLVPYESAWNAHHLWAVKWVSLANCGGANNPVVSKPKLHTHPVPQLLVPYSKLIWPYSHLSLGKLIRRICSGRKTLVFSKSVGEVRLPEWQYFCGFLKILLSHAMKWHQHFVWLCCRHELVYPAGLLIFRLLMMIVWIPILILASVFTIFF